MTAEKILEQARILLGIQKEADKKQLFEKAKTTDGVEIGTETDKPFEIGDNILWVNPDTGTVEGCPDGEYILEDGRTIVVGEMTIKDIKPKADEDKPADEAPADASADTNAIKQAKADELDQLRSEVSALKVKLAEAEKEKIKQAELIELLKSEPAAEPTVRTAESSNDNSVKHNLDLFPKTNFYQSVGKLINETKVKKSNKIK